MQQLLEFQGLALVRAVALLVRRSRRSPVSAASATQLPLILAASPESDQEAFARLAHAPRGSAERALYQLVSEHGLSGSCDLLGLQELTHVMLGWIRVGAVPPLWADRIRMAAQGASHVRRGPLPGGAQDERRAALRQLAHLSSRKAASILGVARDTVMRWRAEEQQRGG